MPTPEQELESLRASGLLRTLRPLDSPAKAQISREGRTLWNFGSNDYLGLATHPAISAAFREGIERFGNGSAASRLVTGTQPPHTALEQQLAEAKGTAAALTFSSGFATALGAIPAIVGKGDFIILDKLAHASLVDASRLSSATMRVFPHNHMGKLRNLLASIRTKHAESRILIVTESVFSMDGDVCPLREILDLADAFAALTLIDEAHAFGLMGDSGMGLAESLGLQPRITFQMGTFSKAAGLSGGYIATSQPWADLLVNRARSFIYTTAPPPALAHAITCSLGIIRSAEGEQLRKALRANIRILSQSAVSPIIPKILGDNEAALAAAKQLEDAGFLVPAIRFPTVPRGTARLRISVSAGHPPEVVGELARSC